LNVKGILFRRLTSFAEKHPALFTSAGFCGIVGLCSIVFWGPLGLLSSGPPVALALNTNNQTRQCGCAQTKTEIKIGELHDARLVVVNQKGATIWRISAILNLNQP
jgi:hypothetical protein